MEELQDAIEDAQYVNAIATADEGPRPVLAWEIPNEEQLEVWKRKQKSLASKSSSQQQSYNPDAFSIDWCLQSAIGFFLFSTYLKEICDDYLKINFCEEIIRWKKLRGKYRVERAKKIVEVYLKELPVDEMTGEKVSPEKTQIDEYDLMRRPTNPIHDLGMSSREEFYKFYDLHIDSTKSKNCLGVKGPALDEILREIKTVDKAMAVQRRSTSTMSRNSSSGGGNNNGAIVDETGSISSSGTGPTSISSAGKRESAGSGSLTEDSNIAATTGGMSSHLKQQKEKYSSLKQLTQSWKERKDSHLPDTLFDKIEAVTIECLRRQYFQGFKESEYYTKMNNFLWFQDRDVVPDDFFTMRVLGRGGFGLVIGKWLY